MVEERHQIYNYLSKLGKLQNKPLIIVVVVTQTAPNVSPKISLPEIAISTIAKTEYVNEKRKENEKSLDVAIGTQVHNQNKTKIKTKTEKGDNNNLPKQR